VIFYRGHLGVKTVIRISVDARKAIQFLEQEKMQLKTVDKNFCHAKMYQYKAKDSRHSFYTVEAQI
jgi:hypothetical protein